MNRPGSLSRRLALMTSAGFVAIWLLAGLATALVLRHEQEELLDLQLRETARVFLPVLAERWAADGAAAALPRPAATPTRRWSTCWSIPPGGSCCDPPARPVRCCPRARPGPAMSGPKPMPSM